KKPAAKKAPAAPAAPTVSPPAKTALSPQAAWPFPTGTKP
ncbi:MAG TPA: histone, partial [Piscinibacter sp.]|nr:histone [Piscinibacter sp.]